MHFRYLNFPALFYVFIFHCTDNEEPAWVAEGGYERVQQCCLYYHSQSGYYYEAVSYGGIRDTVFVGLSKIWHKIYSIK